MEGLQGTETSVTREVSLAFGEMTKRQMRKLLMDSRSEAESTLTQGLRTLTIFSPLDLIGKRQDSPKASCKHTRKAMATLQLWLPRLNWLVGGRLSAQRLGQGCKNLPTELGQ